MKTLFLTILLALAAILPIYGKSESSNPESNQKRTEDVKNKNPQISPAVPTAHINVVNQQASDTQKERAENNSQSYLRRLFSPENLPNLLLFLAGVIGIVIAVCTLKVIKDQTKTMRDSVRLQEVGMRQWLNLEKWSTQLGTSGPEKGLMVSFQIANPTPVPLRLDSLVVKFGGGNNLDIKPSSLIAQGNPYVVTITILLTDGQVESYQTNELPFGTQSNTIFTDGLGQQWEQVFGRMLICGKSGTPYVLATENKLHPVEPQKAAKN